MALELSPFAPHANERQGACLMTDEAEAGHLHSSAPQTGMGLFFPGGDTTHLSGRTWLELPSPQVWDSGSFPTLSKIRPLLTMICQIYDDLKIMPLVSISLNRLQKSKNLKDVSSSP